MTLLLAAALPAAVRAADAPVVPRWSVALAGAPAAPTLSDADQVYVALRAGTIVAYSIEDGHERWRSELTTDQPMAVASDTIFVAAGGAVHALRAADGTSVWRAPDLVPTAPLLARAGWLVVATEAGLVALRAADGAVVWRRQIGAIHEQPAIEGDRLYASTADGRIVALDVRSGTPIWEQRLDAAPGAILALPDRVFVGAARRLFCLKTVDGGIDWVWRIGAEIKGRPAADADRVYFAALDNVLHAQDRRSGVQRWRAELSRRPDAGPLLDGATVLVPSTSAEVWRFDAATGRRAASLRLPGDPAVSPDVATEAADSLRVLVVVGSLSNEWRLTRMGSLEVPALVPLTALPGQPIPLRF
ncbi:MAG TPA: PQQ-binding-like beta-propeller repeat protein [Vicinamibacterales bacterium]|nr:PQQ-binding-like beta-propeller repeat protein [Vicinamibacterales bacterium]